MDEPLEISSDESLKVPQLPPKEFLNPYIIGAFTGLVLVLSVWSSDKFFSSATMFQQTVGLIEQFLMPDYVARNEFFQKHPPEVNWQFMFVVGSFFGSFIAAVMSRTFKLQAVPPMWKQQFGPSFRKRAGFAFIGGLLALYGARLADGCPSGHGLSGVAQLSVSGIIALACFFLSGIVMARLLYRKVAGR